MDAIVKDTLNSDAETVVKKLSEEIPGFNFNMDSYKEKFMKAMEDEINSGKTAEDKAKIKKQIQDVDMLELQNTGGTSNITDIRNVVRENYTHNSLLNSVKNRANLSSIENEADVQPSKPKIDWSASFSKAKTNASDADLAEGSAKITRPFGYVINKSEQIERGIDAEKIGKLPIITKDSDTGNLTPSNNSVDLQPKLTKFINKGKNLQTLEDLKLEDKAIFEYESLQVKPDTLINKLKDLPDYAEDSYIDKVITTNIDENIKKMITESDGKVSKQYIIERLLLENPNHKDKILSVVGKTFDEQLNYWENKFSARDFARLKKGLLKEDLKELQELSENKTIDQIKTVATVNKSHINFLKEIKTKASQTSLNKSSFDTTHLDDTMNLFE
jgi:hypothetical protein